MPYNFAAESFHTQKTLSQTLFESSPLLYEKQLLYNLSCLWEVRGNVRCSS